MASRIKVKEGTGTYPLARNVSMSVWMGFRNLPWNDGYFSFHKTSDLQAIGASQALVFVDERDDSIDDGEFAIDMGTAQIPNVPGDYHGGSGGITFADGHAEIHRWQSPDVLRPQQMGTQTKKWEFMPVAATNPDLIWLRAHATVHQ